MKATLLLLSQKLGPVSSILFSLGKEDTFESRAETTGKLGAALSLMGANANPVHLLTLGKDETNPAAIIHNPSEDEIDQVIDAIEDNGIDDNCIVVFGDGPAYQFNKDASEVTDLGRIYVAQGLAAMKEVKAFGFGYYDTNSDVYFMFENVHGTLEERQALTQSSSDSEDVG